MGESGTPTPDSFTEADLCLGDPVAWTRFLVSIPSVNPSLEAGGAGEAEIASTIRPYLERWGFQVELREPQPGRVSLLASFGSGAPTLLLCGHLDTVGVAGMRIPPFDPGSGPDQVLGRGSADMKGGVAVILSAAAAVARMDDAFPGTLVIALTADEEHASLGLADLLHHGLRADAAVVTEPTSLAMAPANKGFLWMTLRAEGKAAHGSRPELGRDAIRGLARAIVALDGLDAAGQGPLDVGGMPNHILLGGASMHAGTIRGGEAPSVYPALAEVTLEARLLPGDDPEAVLDAVRKVVQSVEAHCPGIRFSLEAGMFRPAAALSLETPLIRGLEASLEACGVEPRVVAMTAWVESAWLMQAGIPALCFGPGSIAQAHTEDEFIAEQEIRTAARVLTHLVAAGRWT
jgi:acetylornithine deacetylase